MSRAEMERDRGRSGHWPGHPADTGFSYLHTITITVLPSLWLSSQPLSHYLRVRSPIRQRNENRYIFHLQFLVYSKRFGDGCSVSTQLSEEFSALSSKKCSRRAILTITNYERCYSIYLGTKRLARGSEHYCDGSHETGDQERGGQQQRAVEIRRCAAN